MLLMSSSHTWSRREFLGASALTVVGAPLFSRAQTGLLSGFTHRTLNGWITDLATEPDPNAAWPSMRLDEPLLKD
jgi:hypothetical protein